MDAVGQFKYLSGKVILMLRRLSLLIVFGILALSVILPVFSEHAYVTIKDPSSDARITGIAMTYDSGPAACTDISPQTAESVCGYDHTYYVGDEEGTWTATVVSKTWECYKSAPGGSWVLDTSCDASCGSSEDCYRLDETKSDEPIYIVNWDATSGNCTHSDTPKTDAVNEFFSAGVGGSGSNPYCCGDDTTTDDFSRHTASLTTGTIVNCRQCLNGADQGTTSNLHGNGWYSGNLGTDLSVDCYWDNIVCTATSAAEGSHTVRYGNGYWLAGTTTCYTGNIACSDGSSANGGITATLCSQPDTQCCPTQVNRAEGVACNDGSVSGTNYDRDTSEARCIDGSSTGCTTHDWLGGQCCGNEGTNDDYENSGAGNSCCINGNPVTNGTLDSTSQFLCLEGLIYGCNGLPQGGVGTQDGDCARRWSLYCDGDGTGANTWKTHIAHNSAADDCDGLGTEYPYGAGEAGTAGDQESCVGNRMWSDRGNGIGNQNQGYLCTASTWYGPYIGDCSLSQSDSGDDFMTFTINWDVTDENPDTYSSTGHHRWRIDDDGVGTGLCVYGTNGCFYDTGLRNYCNNTDANEGTYGDYYTETLSWTALDTKPDDEIAYYLEIGEEECSSAQITDIEDPNSNEGSCTTTATICVPPGYPAVADNDCCPNGAVTGTYPGKDDDGGNCVKCDTDDTQLIGGTGNGLCESKCGAGANCDEITQTECSTNEQYYCDNSCVQIDRDTDETVCEDNTGCTEFIWIHSSACCGDDGGSDTIYSQGDGFLCYQGTTYSCNDPDTESLDIDYASGGRVGSYYCTASGWDTSLPVDYDDSKTYCEGGGGTWFGGSGEEGCCESGEEFVSDIVIEDDLELYFRFTESLAAGTVDDTQNGLVGHLQGNAAIVTSTAYTVNPNAVDFDGTNSYINANDDPSLDLDKNVTVCAWVYPESTGTNYHAVLSKGCGGSYRNYNMYVRDTDDDGDFLIHFSHQTESSPETGGYNGTASPEVVMRDQWNFICAQAYPLSGGTHRYFANGKLLNTDTSPDFTSLKTNDRDFCVGATGGTYFDGKIDEVMVWNRTLSEEEVAILYRSFPERTQNDTYLYFDLDEGSGDPVDKSQYGNDGVRSGASWVTGKSGSSLDFDGSTDHVNTSSGWNPKGDFTVMAFVNTNQSMAGDTRYRDPAIIATQGIGGLTEDWTLTLYHGQLSWYDQFNGAAHDGQSSENVSDGAWHHVAAVRDGSNVYLYVDSSLVDTVSSATGAIRDHTINLGVFWWDQAVFFDGLIDEVRVFDRALGTGEIVYYSDVEKWKKYGCDDSASTICESTDDCYKTVDDGGIAYYCYDSYYNDYRLIVDNCQNVCTDQGGSWEGGGGDKNCCISNTETWCNEEVGIDNLCYAGVVYPCDYWCDVLGTVDGYDCTSDADGDCTSDTTCGSGTCSCFKSVGTICTQSTECSNGNCIDYQRTTTADPSLGKMYSAAEIGLSGKVCCPSGACAFDQDKDDTIDSCATDTSYSVDPDRDDDLDYCNNGVWQECENGISVNNISSDCECLGAGISVNKSNLGVCRVPPINFAYDTDITCGTKCDSDSDLLNTEIIDGAGQCVIPETGCSTVLEEVSWSGNDTLIEVSVTTNCPCDEDASCSVNVSQDGSELAYNAFTGLDGLSTQTTIEPNFNYGDNNITVSCSCSTVAVICSRTYPATIKSSAIITDPDCVSGKNCYISINVSNVGNVMSNTEASLDAVYGSIIYTNTSSYNLAGNTSHVFTFVNNQSCDWQNATWLTGKVNVLVDYEATIDLTEATYQFGVNETGVIKQCDVAADCTTCCAGYWWCWHNSSSAGDFTCSEGVCCPSNEHFQNGACCISSERCCIDDSNCNDGEWCDNYTTGFPDGDLFCRDKEAIGSSCTNDRECLSEYCGNGICADPNPVQLSEWYECNPYSGNAFCSYESVSGTYSFDPQGCNQDGDCSSKYYCYIPRRACLECANASTTYGSLNISDDGLCPSTSCIGYDLDCCSSDGDCASGEWCDAAGSCKGCSTRSDGVCASSSCISSDPDCCTTDGDCGQGLSCVFNACTGNIGESCSGDGDCTGGLKCLGTPGVCAKESFISLSPEETTYTASLGSVIQLTLIVADPQNKQDSYKVEVDPSYIPDSAFVEIDGVKSEEFEMSAGEVRKFLVSVAAAKITDSSPDIESVIRVESLTTPAVDDQVTIRVNVELVNPEGVPSAPLNAWLGVLILGYIIGLVTRG